MPIREIQMLYAYNAWANTRILDTAAQLPAEQFLTAALGSYRLRDILEHILVVESIWHLRWQSIDPESVTFPDAFPTLDSLRRQWDVEEQQLNAFLAALSTTDVKRLVTYRGDDGTIETWTLWQLLLHVVTHGTEHRSEAAMVLTELGHSPGALDVTTFVREREGEL
jgi:uncharacterized damage-inducible protein DinB